MKIIHCEGSPFIPPNNQFLKGHIYAGNTHGRLYLCHEAKQQPAGLHDPMIPALLDLKTYQSLIGGTPKLYTDVTLQWELREICNES